MSVIKSHLGAVKDVETLMEVLYALVMRDTNCTTLTLNFVLVWQYQLTI